MGWRILLIALFFLVGLYLGNLVDLYLTEWVARWIADSAIEAASFFGCALSFVLPPFEAERRVSRVLERRNS
jgi:hypothetical protein